MAGDFPPTLSGGFLLRVIGGDTGWADDGKVTPTVLYTEAGMVVTSLTTEAGAGVTGVNALEVEDELPILTMTRTTTMITTRPTAPQAIMAPVILRGWRAGAGLVPGRGVFPPLRGAAPVALPDFPVGALPEIGRLWALLRSLAL